MTNDEIIKALHLCGHFNSCAECPLAHIEGEDKCKSVLMLNALALIYELMGDKASLSAELDDMREVMHLFQDKCARLEKVADNE